MKLTDPQLIKHLEENYYIARKSWPRYMAYYHNTKSLRFVCHPLEYKQGFTLEDIKADDWFLCHK